MVSFINSKFVPSDEALLHVSDLSVQRGYGIFDFLKVVDGHPYFLNDYLDRFFNSATIMRMPVPLERARLTSVIREMIERNNIASSGIKIILTGGYSADGYTPTQSNLILTQHNLVLPTQEQIDKGVRIITHDYVRDIPEVKTINYTMGIWLIEKIKAQNAYDVLYYKDGIVSEFPRSNFFLVRKDGTIVTPEKNILAGVTRKNILHVASEIAETMECDVSLNDVFEAKEAFITSTTKRIIPITEIDGRIVGSGKPGPVAAALLKGLIEREIGDRTTGS